MNVVFVGPSGSGKTYIRDFICKNFRYEKSTSITTRQKRFGEIDGVEYRFVDKNNFNKMLRDGDIIEHTEYMGELYGIHINDACKNSNIISILTPDGLSSMKKYCNDCTSFYIDSDEDVRRYRMTLRGDTVSDIDKRIEADKTRFDKKSNEIDFIVSNNSCVEEVVSHIFCRLAEV